MAINQIKPISMRLPNDLLLKCQMAGEAIVADLANPIEVRDRQAAALSSHGAEFDVNLQTNAKAAECIFCLWAGVDPEIALNWRHADGGFDLFWLKARIDVKHTKYPRGSLIWPVKKQYLLLEKHFDIFVLITGNHCDFDLIGWTTKHEFINNHRVATANDRLSLGTWFMPQHILRPMQTLEDSLLFWADLDDDNSQEDYLA